MEQRRRRPRERSDAVRILAPRFRRLAAQRPRRRHERDLGLRETPRPAQRADRLRHHADRRAVHERHQGNRCGFARGVVHRGGARGGDGEAGADGRGAPDFSRAGDLRQTGGEHRSHLGRTPRTQRRLVVVEGRSQALRHQLRGARRPLRAHRRMATRRERSVDGAAVQPCGQPLQGRGDDPRAKAVPTPEAYDLRRW